MTEKSITTTPFKMELVNVTSEGKPTLKEKYLNMILVYGVDFIPVSDEVVDEVAKMLIENINNQIMGN